MDSVKEKKTVEVDENQELPRIDFNAISDEIRGVFMLERGFFFTIKELLLCPGQAVQIYLRKDRQRLVKPIVFLILGSLVYTLIDQYFPFQEKYMSPIGVEDNFVASIARWISENYGYSNLLMNVFLVVWLKLFFRKENYTIFEIAILLCYVMGMGMILLGIFGFVENRMEIALVQYGALLSALYSAWAIGQFFGNKIMNYIKGLAAYILGSITFTITAILFGVLLEIILK